MSSGPYTGHHFGNYNGDTPPMRLERRLCLLSPTIDHAARAEQLIEELLEHHNARMAELATARRQREFAKNWKEVSKP